MRVIRMRPIVGAMILALIASACSGSQAKPKAVPKELACQLVSLTTAQQVMGNTDLALQSVDMGPGAVDSECLYSHSSGTTPVFSQVFIEVYRQSTSAAHAITRREEKENSAHVSEVRQGKGYYRTATVQLVDLKTTPALAGATYAVYTHVRKYGFDELLVNNNRYSVLIRLAPYTWVHALDLAEVVLPKLPST